MQNFVWIQIDMDADADAAIHKKKVWIRYDNINNFESRNE